MRYLKSYKIFENNTDIIKFDLEDIFLDVKDTHSEEKWIIWADGGLYTPGKEFNNYYTVYISFGEEDPYNNEYLEDEELIHDYPQVKISEELMKCIERSMEYMKDWNCKIFIQSEYSSDPSEDDVEEITIDDLQANQWIAENQSIKLIFRK
jgi:hypothetical protein